MLEQRLNLNIRQKEDCTLELAAPLSRRRWFSFTLQTLFLAVTVVCVALVPIGAAFLRLRAARQLQKNGVSVQWEDGDRVDDWDLQRSLQGFPMSIETEEVEIPVSQLVRIRPVSETRFCGVDCTLDDEDLAVIGGFRELRKLTIDSSHVSTDGIRSVSELPHIERLLLRGSEAKLNGVGPVLSGMKSLCFLAVNSRRFTDEELRHVSKLYDLEVLDLSGTSITDAGVAQLCSLRRLRRLYCLFTGLTDECVPAITNIENLEVLYIDCTEVSEEGERELRRLMPSLRIDPG